MMRVDMTVGKNEFYYKAQEALTSHGYQFFDGDKDIRGKGIHHANKPDYIAIKGNTVVIGEIKSPAESPKTGSWRQIQKGDSEEFKKIRLDVVKREWEGNLLPEVGGHEIIIRGQIPDYMRKIGITYELPVSFSGKQNIICGYTVPMTEQMNVKRALDNCNVKTINRIDGGNGSITYLFSV
jgi:hypothetical protein